MQITEIRIAGFKSFVDPQTVPIEPGLTGIVGPNGCGKSNLLEALRWAMGASSAKAMRGGEMDDLIFSGSQHRPARETAEVVLVLDNSKRTAPAEFNGDDVLEIERRLRRGAGSSYRINGRTVRGKDIQLLFADASTGANSPALVRQGQISELIGSKPQNRRRILEEAAGITGLNTRRHEAELKLAAAEDNLQRLSEISSEIERQLTSLKRQAGKARRYRKLSEEVRSLEALLAHLRWVEASEAADSARAEVHGFRERVEQTSCADAQCERARLDASEGLAELREAEMSAAAHLGEARITLARLETERQAAVAAEERLSAEASRAVLDFERETGALAEAKAAVESARADLSALPRDNQGLQHRLENDAKNALHEASEALQAAEDEHDTAQAALAEARARRKAAEDNAAAHQARREALQAEIARLQSEMTGLEDTAILALNLRQARNDLAAAEMAFHDAERAAENAEAELTATRGAKTAAQPAFEEADRAVRALEAEISGLEKLLRRQEGSSHPGVVEQIRTRKGYEKAIAAAFGDDIDAPTDRTAPSFWAGALAKGNPLPEGAEPLLAYVEAPKELQARLAQCGLVDPEQGERLCALLVPGQRLVSLDGHLWRWDGFTRTPSAPVSAAARLEQQARLEEARIELNRLKAERTIHAEALARAREARQLAEETTRHLRQQVSPAQRALNEARARTAEASQASDRAMLKREANSDALARAEADLAVVDAALSLLQDGKEAMEDARLEAALHAAKTRLSDARSAEAEARSRLMELARGREQAAERRSSVMRDVEAWQARLEATQARIAALSERRADIAAQAISAKERPQALAEQLEALATEAEILEARRTECANALAAKETTIREADAAARKAATEAGQAREALAAWQVKLETAETRLAEVIDFARHTFMRAPDGLLAIAQAGLDDGMTDAMDIREAEKCLDERRRERDQLGGVNMNADEEAVELESRLGLQLAERDDLAAAIAKLREGVQALNAEGRERLNAAFETVNSHFQALFTALFQGGQAELRLIDADDPLQAGLEIFAQPPGKKLGTLALMSGGEQALTATALIFAVFLSRPAPICVLDEVDAPLDDANVDRFCNLLDEMRRRTDTRFIVITHNAVTMSRVDRLFGVTMREKGVSRLVSVDLEGAEQLVAAE